MVAAAGQLLVTLLSLAMGVRLLLLARRTRQLPELLLGSVGLSGFLSNASFLLYYMADLGDATRSGLVILLRLGVFGTSFFMAILAWQVFRRDQPWVGFATGLLVALLLPELLSEWAYRGDTPAELFSNPFYLGAFLAKISCFVWPGLEATMYFVDARRRLRMGLASNPVAINRSLLLGLGFLSLGLFWSVRLVETFLNVFWGIQGIGLHGILIPCSMVWCLTMWLAFFPPRAYLRWLEAAAPAERAA